MLVLSRKAGERIIIGDNISLTVLAIHGNVVRLGVVAPTEISIRRMEIYCPLEPIGEELPQETASPTQGANGGPPQPPG